MGPLENLENQEWRVVHDQKEKRETREGLGQKVCRELLEYLEKRVRLVQKSREEKERY